MNIPTRGTPKDDLLASLDRARDKDADWRHARTFSLVYYAGEDVLEVAKQASLAYFSENALNPMAFPSLRRFETEVVSMACGLVHNGAGCGSMTAGGSESILMAVKTAREWARKEKGVTAPEMVLPVTVHPAFEKAAHYFDVKAVHVPVDASFRADVGAMEEATGPNTVLLVGSAPAYPHGVVDPIERIGALAADRGILCHVDACVGGFMLPWLEKLGHPVPPFDFRVRGVTSMSADVHKYGFAAKGASVVLYRTRALRRHQFVTYADWPGGLYGSPTATGTRPGGPIAAAWAVLQYLGEEGYLRIARESMDTARTIMDGVRAIPGLKVLGEPVMPIFAFGSDEIDVYALADRMDERGWHLDRNQLPPSLHMMITPAHAAVAGAMLADLRASVEEVRKNGPGAEGSAAMYGMLGSLPDRAQVEGFVLEFMDSLDAGGGAS